MTRVLDFATKPTLTGARAILRPYIDADLPALREAMADLDLLRLTGSIHDEAEALKPISPEEEQLRQDWFYTRNDQDDRLDLAIVDKASGDCVGEAVLNQGDPGNQSCNFRILIGPAGQNRGLGTEATRLIVGYGFEKLGLHRISLEVYAFNPAPAESTRGWASGPRGAPRVAPLRRPVDRRHRDVHSRFALASRPGRPVIMDRCVHPRVHNGPSSAPYRRRREITARSAKRSARRVLGAAR